MSYCVVIPARNEERTIGPLVGSLRRLGFRVIVVDDGSTDDTLAQAVDAGASVIPHHERHGIGPSTIEGWNLAYLYADCDGVLQMDAGGSHSPGDALAMIAPLSWGADVVLGTRFTWGGAYLGGRWWRRLGSRLITVACNAVQRGAHWSDWTSGYRAFSPRAIRVLQRPHYSTTGHTWHMEVLAYAGEKGLRIEQMPIIYTAGESSFSWRTAVDALRIWLEIMHHRRPVLAPDPARGRAR